MTRSTFTRTSAPFLALGCVGFIASAPATAETGIDPDGSIVVTGERTDELSIDQATAPVLDTPRTINVVTEEALEQTASYSFEEALRMVPGITLGAGEGGTAAADIPLIRGVDATGDVFVDGARDLGSQTRETFAVERIEVFKGPSGALGGRGRLHLAGREEGRQKCVVQHRQTRERAYPIDPGVVARPDNAQLKE